jgi:hypothetical protein
MCQFCVGGIVQPEFKNMEKLSIMHFELVISIKVLSLKGMLLVRITNPKQPASGFLAKKCESLS